jgi:hypothetical protein
MSVKSLVWGDSKKEEAMLSSALHFRNVPHPWALPIVKHEVKVIMNLNIPRSLGIGGGKALTLTHKSGRDLTPTS